MTYRYPFTPFPTGWYRVHAHNHIVHALGKELHFKRNADGSPLLFDPHDLEKSYPTLEKNNDLYVFFDPDNKAPYFDVPTITEFNDPQWQKPFRLSWKKIRMHPQEIAENALDLGHFITVHTFQHIPTVLKFNISNHQFNIKFRSTLKSMGFPSQTEMEITYHGLGISVSTVTVSGNINARILLTLTPVETETVDITMDVALQKTRNSFKNIFLRCFLPMATKKEFEHDIPIWETKRYPLKPVLCEADANIIRVRKWAKQFYTQNCTNQHERNMPN